MTESRNRPCGDKSAWPFQFDAQMEDWYNSTSGGGSSSGRTAAFGAVNPGSNPGPPVLSPPSLLSATVRFPGIASEADTSPPANPCRQGRVALGGFASPTRQT